MPLRASETVRVVAVVTTLVAGLLMGSPASLQSQLVSRGLTRIGGYEAVEGEVLVKYRDGSAVSQHARVESLADADEVQLLNSRGVRRLHSRRLTTPALLQSLRSDPDVEYAEPNYVLYAMVFPNDPSFSSLWGLLNTGFNPVGGGGLPGADIDAATAWNTTTGSTANVVGVVDTGIDYNHPDLAASVWTAPSTFQVTVGAQTITCEAGTHGFNAIARTCNPMDDQFHGTHVSGTIGAVGNNGIGGVGVNWSARMMGLKFLNASASGVTSDAIAAIEFAVQTKAAFSATAGANIRVLSNSWGGGAYSTALLDAINATNANDMLFVAAAGNSSTNLDAQPSYPASYPAANLVAVASSDSSDQLSTFSSYGAASVHLAAPGTAILSTVPNNSYAILQGTSMATPQVSGAAMLALSMCGVTTAQLKTLLLQNVDLLPAFAPVTTTGGRLNAARMISGCPFPKVTGLPLVPNVAAPQAVGSTINWTATPAGGQAPYQYRWLVWNGAAWVDMTGWTAANTFAWTPSVANTGYRVAARVRSAWNTGAREVETIQDFAIMPKVTSLQLAPNVAAPQGTGTTITWTATPAGGQAPFQYRWLVWTGAAWVDMSGWTAANTFAWTPSVANTGYRVAARVRSAWNTGAREVETSQAFAILPKVTSMPLTPSVPAPRGVGSTITWTAAPSGGEAPYQYRWLVWNGAAWLDMTGWTAASTFAWTPSVANTEYRIAVRVRSAWNTGSRDLETIQAFPIMPAVTSMTLTPGVAAPQGPGTTITWTAVAAGGQAPYQYRFLIWDGTMWSVLTPWAMANTFAWTPGVINPDYQIAVRVRSAWNMGTRDFETIQPFPIQ